MNCSPPGSPVHGILQARKLERVAILYSSESSDPGSEPVSPVSPELAGGFFTTEPPGKPGFPLGKMENFCGWMVAPHYECI